MRVEITYPLIFNKRVPPFSIEKARIEAEGPIVNNLYRIQPNETIIEIPRDIELKSITFSLPRTEIKEYFYAYPEYFLTGKEIDRQTTVETGYLSFNTSEFVIWCKCYTKSGRWITGKGGDLLISHKRKAILETTVFEGNGLVMEANDVIYISFLALDISGLRGYKLNNRQFNIHRTTSLYTGKSYKETNEIHEGIFDTSIPTFLFIEPAGKDLPEGCFLDITVMSEIVRR